MHGTFKRKPTPLRKKQPWILQGLMQAAIANGDKKGAAVFIRAARQAGVPVAAKTAAWAKTHHETMRALKVKPLRGLLKKRPVLEKKSRANVAPVPR